MVPARLCRRLLAGDRRTDRPAALIRNYDFSPKLLEGTWLASRFCGKRVVAMVDCLWGVLDGINEDGLAVSLSFGGRTAVGEGFGIPLALRYVLEFASNVEEAVAILEARAGAHVLFGRAARSRRAACDRLRHAGPPGRSASSAASSPTTSTSRNGSATPQTTRSVEREEALQRAVGKIGDPEAMLGVFLQPPVYQTSYGRGYGTLYTALYRPAGCLGRAGLAVGALAAVLRGLR